MRTTPRCACLPRDHPLLILALAIVLVVLGAPTCCTAIPANHAMTTKKSISTLHAPSDAHAEVLASSAMSSNNRRLQAVDLYGATVNGVLKVIANGVLDDNMFVNPAAMFGSVIQVPSSCSTYMLGAAQVPVSASECEFGLADPLDRRLLTVDVTERTIKVSYTGFGYTGFSLFFSFSCTRFQGLVPLKTLDTFESGTISSISLTGDTLTFTIGEITVPSSPVVTFSLFEPCTGSPTSPNTNYISAGCDTTPQGRSCTGTCDVGSVPDPNSPPSATCIPNPADGSSSWQTTGVCAKACTAPPTSPTGTDLSLCSGNNLNTCTGRCASGYLLPLGGAAPTARCVVNFAQPNVEGTWSISAGDCYQACTSPAPSPTGTDLSTCIGDRTTTCNGRCATGYLLPDGGAAPTATCVPNAAQTNMGIWRTTAGACYMACPTPAPFPEGTDLSACSGDKTTTCIGRCSTGYLLPDGGAAPTATCLPSATRPDTGIWRTTAGACYKAVPLGTFLLQAEQLPQPDAYLTPHSPIKASGASRPENASRLV